MVVNYPTGGLSPFLNLFRARGNVYWKGAVMAFPCACSSALLKIAMSNGLLYGNGVFGFMNWSQDHEIFKNSSPWTGFLSLVVFLMVFRVAEANKRFFQAASACFGFRSQWLDVANSVSAFAEHSKVSDAEKMLLKRRTMRLLSLLHGLALQQLGNDSSGSTHEILMVSLGPGVLDRDSAVLVASVAPARRVFLVQHWIQILLIQAIKSGVLDMQPAMLSRCFQQLGNGKVSYTDGLRIREIPFPFPYSQTCHLMLCAYNICCPIIIQTWTSTTLWSFFFCFFMVMPMWALEYFASDLDLPYRHGANTLPIGEFQQRFNEELGQLLAPGAEKPPTESQEEDDLASFLKAIGEPVASS
mmetsp:Transcript_12565/g.22189  ORF Transcript_12565/g.22189 Transcript_12565/m.22189 type:complete len:357 (+) Transcript_12565:66-1136(+)